ncbi:MAG: DUF2169 domain-containing protein [Planctomycetota bacterium]
MHIQNDTRMHFAPHTTSRTPPQPEYVAIVRGVFTIGAPTPDSPYAPLSQCEDLMDQGFMSGDTWDPDDEDRRGDITRASDFSDFKPNGEIFLTATAHAPKGAPVGQLPVRVKVGSIDKALVVTGDRTWQQKAIGVELSPPLPFASMPIVWSRAYGGPGNKRNPAGCGAADDARVPNVESPAALIRSKSDAPAPAGFSPISPQWSPRSEKRGRNYGAAWRKTRWPFYSDDFDWSHFCQAPADQQLPAGMYFNGDEELIFQNLHPDHEVLRVKLPGVRPRVFVDGPDGASSHGFREIELVLDTVHADLDAGRIVLLWRGVGPVDQRDRSDTPWALVVKEQVADAPRPIGDYEEQMRAFQADPIGMKAAMKQHAPAGIEDVLDAPEGGHPADTGNPLSDMLKQRMGGLAAEQQQMLQDQLNAALANAPGAPPGGMSLEDMLAKAVAKAAEPVTGPTIPAVPFAPVVPHVDMSWFMKQLASAKGALIAMGYDGPMLGQLDAALNDPRVAELHKGYTPPPVPERDDILKQPEEGKLPEKPTGPPGGTPAPATDEPPAGAEGRDLRNRDYSNQDLTHEDFSSCDLTGCNFTGANCAGVMFIGAVMRNVTADKADFSGCVFAGAECAASSFSEARLDHADFTDASLEMCVFRAASLKEAKLIGATLKMSMFMNADLTGAKAAGCEGERAILDEARLDGADFSGAMFDRASMRKCSAQRLDLSGATLTNCNFMECDLGGAALTGVTAIDCSFQDAKLLTTDLSDSDIKRSLFQRATMEAVRAVAADFAESCFRRATITACDCSGANFGKAELNNATVTASRFVGANFWHTVLQETVLDNCDLTGVSLKHVLGSTEMGVGL